MYLVDLAERVAVVDDRELELLGWLAGDRSPAFGVPAFENPRRRSPGTSSLRRDDRHEPRLLGRSIDRFREPGRLGDRQDRRELGLGLRLVTELVSSPATPLVAVAAIRSSERRELLATSRARPHASHGTALCTRASIV